MYFCFDKCNLLLLIVVGFFCLGFFVWLVSFLSVCFFLYNLKQSSIEDDLWWLEICDMLNVVGFL